MFNTSTFYKIYDKLFMNNFLDIIVDGINKKKINLTNKKLTIFDIGSYKGTFSIDLQKKLKNKKRLNVKNLWILIKLNLNFINTMIMQWIHQNHL